MGAPNLGTSDPSISLDAWVILRPPKRPPIFVAPNFEEAPSLGVLMDFLRKYPLVI
jgi:hypothetical protein